MQWEKASALAGAELPDDEDALAECEGTLATSASPEPPPLHAAASTATPAAARTIKGFIDCSFRADPRRPWPGAPH